MSLKFSSLRGKEEKREARLGHTHWSQLESEQNRLIPVQGLKNEQHHPWKIRVTPFYFEKIWHGQQWKIFSFKDNFHLNKCTLKEVYTCRRTSKFEWYWNAAQMSLMNLADDLVSLRWHSFLLGLGGRKENQIPLPGGNLGASVNKTLKECW